MEKHCICCLKKIFDNDGYFKPFNGYNNIADYVFGIHLCQECFKEIGEDYIKTLKEDDGIYYGSD